MFKLLALLSLIGHAYSGYTPVALDKITVDKPGFVTLVPNSDSSKYHIAISSFNGAPFSKDYVYYVSNYTVNGGNVPVQLDNTNIVWPNELSYSSESIFNVKVDPYGGVIVPGGFLVPSKENGGLFYYPFTNKDRSSISATTDPILITINNKTNTKWFYHRVVRVDLNGDNRKDILTCRTFKPLIGTTKVELVALEYDSQSGTYYERLILNNACDVFFEAADLDKDGRIEIVASGFFISKLNVIYTNDPLNNFFNGNIQVKLIDDAGGKFFDVRVEDLDKTGNLELLVTNHQGNKDQILGSVFYYKLDGNIRNGKWTRNTIYNNFPVLKGGLNQAAPGSAKAFYPNLKDTSGSPYLLVAGDGSEYLYLFEPVANTNPLEYKLTWSQLFKDKTVGGTSIADINGDGIAEIIAAIYEANTCVIFTFKL
jgi:hypothetical protein